MTSDFILALFQHGYKARISTLYHLLKGKRSSSVLLYGFLYNNLRFIDFFPTLKESEFNQWLGELSNQGFVQIMDGNLAQITARGLQKLNQDNCSLDTYPWIDNYHFGKKDTDIFRFLQFSVQVVSNLSYDNKQYVPIEPSPIYQLALKKWLTSISKKELIHQLQEEWLRVLERLPNKEAHYVVAQFSGYHQVGKTANQLFNGRLSNLEKKLLHLNYLHHLLQSIQEDTKLPLLHSLINWSFFQSENQSVQETKRYLAANDSIETIAQKRNLKMSTIKDHLIELSLFEVFPFEQFIAEETVVQLSQFSQQPCQEWVYQQARKHYPKLDYFEFRLVQVEMIRKERMK